jgi:hypothetical protein
MSADTGGASSAQFGPSLSLSALAPAMSIH